MKNIQTIILVASIVLISNLAPSQTVYAVSEEGQRALDRIFKEKPCAEQFMENSNYNNSAISIPANLAHRICELEKLSAELERKSAQLQLKLDGVQTQVKNQPTSTKTETVVTQDNSRVEALEQRVSLLERAVNSIQNTVLGAINKAIGILDKLLSR